MTRPDGWNNGTDFDPLTCDFLKVYRRVGGRPCDCDKAAYHTESCWTTPIYAALINQFGSQWALMRDIGTACYWSTKMEGTQ